MYMMLTAYYQPLASEQSASLPFVCAYYNNIHFGIEYLMPMDMWTNVCNQRNQLIPVIFNRKKNRTLEQIKLNKNGIWCSGVFEWGAQLTRHWP